MNANVAYLSFDWALKFDRLVKAFLAMSFSATASFSFWIAYLIQLCSRAYSADGLLSWSLMRSYEIKSLASSDIVAQTGSLKENLPILTFFHNFLVTSSIEWRNTWEYNVSYDTTWPDITFGAVSFGKNFWSDIIRSAKFFIKCLIFIKYQRSSEIDDFNLIKFLILFKQNIFRLQISVNDMICVAIIDARQNLFHE